MTDARAEAEARRRRVGAVPVAFSLDRIELIRWRHATGHTQASVAKAAGLPRSCLGDVEAGRYGSISAETLNALLAALAWCDAHPTGRSSTGRSPGAG